MLVKAGYIEWDNKQKKFIEPNTGVPQGGIISPLLSNLILHEFDIYIEKIIIDRENINRELKKEKPNPRYKLLTRKIKEIHKKIEESSMEHLKLLRKELRRTLKERNRYQKNIPNPSWIKLDYVRYADD